MPPRDPAPPVRAVVVPFDPAVPPPPLARIAPGRVIDRWAAAERAPHAPRLVALADEAGERWDGAALVTARPGTAYLKIVDAVGEIPEVVEAVVAVARAEGLAQVKWEGWTVDPVTAAELGFLPLREPSRDAGPEPVPAAGYVRWLADGVVREPPYYRQSTDFSCAAAAALIAQAHAGALPLEGLGREAELSLWREATNFPACEPVGLGLAVQRTWPASEVEVLLDTERPVLLEHLAEPEQEWRALLQRRSRAEAARTGLPIGTRRIPVQEIRDALDGGESVLLMVTLAGMQGFDVPHWLLCHGTTPGAVVVEDSWTHGAAGETWVDAHLLPIPDAALDAMAGIEGDGFRGAVGVRRR